MPAEDIGFEFIRLFDTTGIQSDIEIGMLRGTYVIRKKSGYELSRDTLETQAEAVEKYRKKLKGAGINIPNNFLVEICTDNKGPYLEQVDELISGRNVGQIVHSGEYTGKMQEEAWKDMLGVILGSHNKDKTTRTLAMLDAKPDNFVLADSGEMFYVDTYPPMLHNADGLIEPFVPEVFKRSILLMSFNFGDIRGMLLKLIALLGIEYPEDKEWLTKLTLKTIEGKIPTDAETFVKEQVSGNLPINRLAYSDKKSDRDKADKEFAKLLAMQ